MSFYDPFKFESTISGIKHNVWGFFSSSDKELQVSNPIHRIFILDRSGSMSWTIDRLIDDVIRALDGSGSNDLYTIMWFSGPGQFRTVFKCARKSDIEFSLSLPKTIQPLRTTLSTTCFSEVLGDLKQVIEETSNLCPNFEVTLFTDGCPVVPWGEKEEINRSTFLVRTVSDRILAFHTVGYGDYYNQQFLQDLSSLSLFGKAIHASKESSFSDIFISNYEKVSNLLPTSIRVKTQGQCDILYMSKKDSKLTHDELFLSNTDPSFRIMIISKNAVSDIVVNDNLTFKSSDFKRIAYPKMDFLYAYASELYYLGKRRVALDIMSRNIKDRRLSDLIVCAFTRDEVAYCQSRINKAAFDYSERFLEGKCQANYTPRKDAFCLFDLFTLFSTHGVLYIPFSKRVPSYSRITRETTDSLGIFKADPKIETKADCDNIVFSKDRLNVSIRFLIYGTVSLDFGEASKVGLPNEIPVSIYRNHSFVKDGSLNIGISEFEVTDDVVLTVLDSQKVKFQLVDKNRIIIDLRKIPVINRTYVDSTMSLKDIFRTVLEITKLEAKQKIINYFYDKEPSVSSVEKSTATRYEKHLTPDQIKVLASYGVDKSFIYNGIGNTRKPVEECDSYDVREMSFFIKGCSSFPKVEDLNTKKSSAVSFRIMLDEYNLLSNETGVCFSSSMTVNMFKRIIDEKSRCKEKLSSLRNDINKIRLSKLLTNDWFEGLDDNFEYKDPSTGYTMVARFTRTREYI